MQTMEETFLFHAQMMDISKFGIEELLNSLYHTNQEKIAYALASSTQLMSFSLQLPEILPVR
jgi:hypothetical protein